MATLMLLMLMVYLVLGLVKLIKGGFVGEFNHAWAGAFNDPLITPPQVMCLVCLMFFALLWAWFLWPFTLAKYQREQAEPPKPWGA